MLSHCLAVDPLMAVELEAGCPGDQRLYCALLVKSPAGNAVATTRHRDIRSQRTSACDKIDLFPRSKADHFEWSGRGEIDARASRAGGNGDKAIAG